MSEETIFKLLESGNLNIKNEIENEPFTISRHFSHSESIESESRYNYNNSSSRAKLKLKDGQVLPKHLKDKFDFDKLACKPLQEVDPYYFRKQTFLTIGKDGTVHRFSGRASSFILNCANPLRTFAICLLSHWYLPVLIGISLCLLCFSFLLPNHANNALTERFIRYFFIGVLLGELGVNGLARGIFVAKFTYLRSPWDWLDLSVIFIVILNFCWDNLFIHSLYGIALLKFIPIVPALKKGFRLLLQILKNLVPVWIYSLLILWILVIIGEQIENFRKPSDSCFAFVNRSLIDFQGEILSDDGKDNFSSSEYLKTTITTNGSDYTNLVNNSSRTCAGAGGMRLMTTSLHNLTLQSLDLVTLGIFGGFQHEINPMKQHFFYTVLNLLFGFFGMGIFTLAGVEGTFLLFRSTRSLPKNTRNLINCLPTVQSPFECDNSALNKINEILYHPFAEVLVTVVISLDVLLISASLIGNFETLPWSQWISYAQKACMVFYVVEFAMKLVTGPFRHLRNRWSLFDGLIILVFAIDALVYPLKWLLPIRIFKITPRWPTLSFISSVPFCVLKFKSPLLCVLLVLLFTLEICARRFIQGPERTLKALNPWSFLFFFNDWSQLLRNQDSYLAKNFFCFIILLLEGLVGTVLVVVIFVSVIHETYEGLRQPSDSISESFKNFVKAVDSIKLVLRKCFFKSEKLPESDTNPTVSTQCNGGHTLGTVDDTSHQQERPVSPESKTYHTVTLQWISLIIILIATIALAFEFDPLQQLLPYKNPRFWIDVIFVVYFFVVLLWKGIFYGVGTLGSPCWMLDFLIITASGFTLYTAILSKPTIRDLPMIKAIAIISCFRSLMLVSRFGWLKVATLGIISEMRILWRYFIALTVVIVFLLSAKKAWVNAKTIENKDYISDNFKPKNNPTTILNSTEMFSTETSKFYPVADLIAALTVLGILAGIIFFELLTNQLVYSFMTSAQLSAYKDLEGRIMMGSKSSNEKKTCIIPHPKSGLCIQIIHYVTQTEAFDLFVTLLIFCDCCVITFSHLATSKDWQIIWSQYPGFILLTYLTELLLKGVGWRRYYFSSGWTIFDSIIVTVGIIDLIFLKVQVGFVTAEFIRFLRILRIFQLKIVTKNAKSIEHFFKAVIRISPIILNLLQLYGLLIYTYFTIGLVSLQSSEGRNLQSSQGVFSFFKHTLVSLILLPYYGSSTFEQTLIAQAPLCWNGYFNSFLSLYIKSYEIFSYIIIFNFFSLSVYEIVKYFQNLEGNASYTKNGVELTEYKYINGALSIARVPPIPLTPDDVESVETLLTPCSPNEVLNLPSDNDKDRVMSDDERYPVKISANGYILRVEAIVTTV